MPGLQGGPGQRVTKHREKLKSLKSIVYDWANREVGESMEQVKQQLGNKATGEVTQAQQTKVEEQIQAMIDNLKVTPPQPDRFASRGGGGGGGGKPPPPRMPTEAELRLLKAFQLGVNKATEAIHAANKKNPADTLALGGRQGEMRNLFDELLKQATQGKLQLGPEP